MSDFRSNLVFISLILFFIIFILIASIFLNINIIYPLIGFSITIFTVIFFMRNNVDQQMYFILFLLVLLNLFNYTQISIIHNFKLPMLRIPLLIIGVFVGLFNTKIKKLKSIFIKNYDVFMFIVVLWITSLFAFNIKTSILYSFWMTLSLLFFILLSNRETIEKQLLRVNNIFILSYSWIVIESFVYLIFHFNTITHRLFGYYGLKNINSWSSVIIVTSIVNKSIMGKKLKSFDYILIIVSLIVSIFSQTRSSLLALLIIGILYVIFYTKKSYLISILIIISLISGGIFINKIVGGMQLPKMFFRVEKMLNDPNNIGVSRKNLWKDNIEYFLENPISGIGIANSKQIFYFIAPSSVKYYSPHNTYIEILSETGILGALFFLIIVFRSFFSGMSFYYKKIIIFNFAGVFIISLFESNFTPGQAVFIPLFYYLLLFRGKSMYEK